MDGVFIVAEQPSVVGATAELVFVVLQPDLGGPSVNTIETVISEPPSPRLVVLDAGTGTERWSVAMSGFSTEVVAPDDDSGTVVAFTGGLTPRSRGSTRAAAPSAGVSR